jgi:hypothetical protein
MVISAKPTRRGPSMRAILTSVIFIGCGIRDYANSSHTPTPHAAEPRIININKAASAEVLFISYLLNTK